MKLAVSALALTAALLAVVPAAAAPTAAEASAFVVDAEARSAKFNDYAAIAGWVYATDINQDTEMLASRAGTEGTQLGVELAKKAATFNDTPGLSYDVRRKLDIMKNGLTLPATEAQAEELNTISTRLGSIYATGTGTYKGQPKKGNDLEALMGETRDPALTKEMWVSWHDNVGKPMKTDYAKLVELSNNGARELGFADTGALWRSGYDMPPEQFAALVDKVWLQVKPLYDDLHCYTRGKLNAKYGDAVQPKTGPIRADLLGNMWAQEWGNIYDVVAPKGLATSATTPGNCSRPRAIRPRRCGGRPRASTPRSGSHRCPRRSGSVRRSSGRRVARWSATPTPAIMTTRTTCASRCAPRSTATISSPSTTRWAIISTSAPTTSSRSST